MKEEEILDALARLEGAVTMIGLFMATQQDLVSLRAAVIERIDRLQATITPTHGPANEDNA